MNLIRFKTTKVAILLLSLTFFGCSGKNNTNSHIESVNDVLATDLKPTNDSLESPDQEAISGDLAALNENEIDGENYSVKVDKAHDEEVAQIHAEIDEAQEHEFKTQPISEEYKTVLEKAQSQEDSVYLENIPVLLSGKSLKPKKFETEMACSDTAAHRLTVAQEKTLVGDIHSICMNVDLLTQGKRRDQSEARQIFRNLQINLETALYIPTQKLQEYRNTDISKMKKIVSCLLVKDVLTVNNLILKERELIERVGSTGVASEEEQTQFEELKEKYLSFDEKKNKTEQEIVTALLTKVDVIPVSLALAQAIKESGWAGATPGARFARQAYSLFGQHGEGDQGVLRTCGKQAIPVANFSTSIKAVQAYMQNLNTGSAYEDLRDLRAQHRKDGEVISGYSLASGLTNYSETGSYIKSLRKDFICRYNWHLLDSFTYVATGNTDKPVSAMFDVARVSENHPCVAK